MASLPNSFTEYLIDEFDSRTPMLARVREIHTFFSAICPEDFSDIFLSEYISTDGTREIESIDLFSSRYNASAPVSRADMLTSIMPLPSEVALIVFDSAAYRIGEATRESRLQVTVQHASQAVSNFKASGTNCDHLMDIIRRYFVAPTKG